MRNILTNITPTDIIYIGGRYNSDGYTESRYNMMRYMLNTRNYTHNENIALTEAVYYILLSLHEPMHGYGIMQNVAEMSDGRLCLAAGTLYGAINTLLEKRWIRALPGEGGSRKKEYVITDEGKTAVKNEIARLRELLRNGEKLSPQYGGGQNG